MFCTLDVFPPTEVQTGDEIRIGTDICINRNTFVRFDLLCDKQPVNLDEGIRTALPTPNRTWTTDPNNTVISSAPFGEESDFNPEFFEDGFRPLLLPGLVGYPISLGPQGELTLSTLILKNLTNPNILPDLVRRDAEFIRNLVIDEFLGTYTCQVENEYGFDTATTTISECGKHFDKTTITARKLLIMIVAQFGW